mgnify:CR=1 FL=1
MTAQKHVRLQHSESVIANMASRIFAAYVQANRIDEKNEDAYIKKATHIAVKMADYADRVVKSDEEFA